MNIDRGPLPKFWYFPRGLKAAIVMTGDDHGNNGTAGRFDIYNADSAARMQRCRLAVRARARRTCIRQRRLRPSQVTAYRRAGLRDRRSYPNERLRTSATISRCPRLLRATTRISSPTFTSGFGSTPIRTNRTHCIVLERLRHAAAGGMQPTAFASTPNYYYWPGAWVNERSGSLYRLGHADAPRRKRMARPSTRIRRRPR